MSVVADLASYRHRTLSGDDLVREVFRHTMLEYVNQCGINHGEFEDYYGCPTWVVDDNLFVVKCDLQDSPAYTLIAADIREHAVVEVLGIAPDGTIRTHPVCSLGSFRASYVLAATNGRGCHHVDYNPTADGACEFDADKVCTHIRNH